MDFNQLLTVLYRIPFARSGWQDFLNELAAQSNSQSGILTLVDPETLRVQADYNYGMDQPKLDQWNEHFITVDPWVRELQKLPDNVIYVGDALVPHREFLESELYCDWARGIGIQHATGGFIRLPTDEAGVLITLQQNGKQGATDDASRHMLNLLIPHIESVLSISQEAKHAGQESDAILEHLDQAAFVCDQRLNVLRHNELAESMLATGSSVRLIDGKLHVMGWVNPSLHSVFDSSVHPTRQGPYRLVTYHENTPYMIKVAPLLTGETVFAGPNSRFLVTIRQANRIDALDTGVLQQIFDLTDREAEIAGLLAQGQSVKEIAAVLKVRESTIRTHVKSLLWKSETHSQQSMIALFHSVSQKLL